MEKSWALVGRAACQWMRASHGRLQADLEATYTRTTCTLPTVMYDCTQRLYDN